MTISPTLSCRPSEDPLRLSMRRVRMVILIFGVLLPYLMRLPGMLFHGPAWLTSYFGNSLLAFLLINAFQAINWLPLYLGTLALRHPRSAIVAAAIGFALPIYGHATLNLASDAQAAVALFVIPIFSLPLVLIGWITGFFIDRKRRPAANL
jgi:hypothetical protein